MGAEWGIRDYSAIQAYQDAICKHLFISFDVFRVFYVYSYFSLRMYAECILSVFQ